MQPHQISKKAKKEVSKAIYLFVLLLISSQNNYAQTNDLELSVTQIIQTGKRGYLNIKIRKPVRKVRLQLNSSLGKISSKKTPETHQKSMQFALHRQKNTAKIHYQGSIKVIFQDGSLGEMPLDFKIQSQKPPEFKLFETINWQKKQLKIQADRLLENIEFTIYAVDGTVIDHNISALRLKTKQKNKFVYLLKWSNPKNTTILELKIKAVAKHNFFKTLELFPYALVVRHKDINFQTNESTILESEKYKLKQVLPEMLTEIKRVKNGIQKLKHNKSLKLYIMGFTDTVGNSDKNQILSESRALSIAKWFASQKLNITIKYRGFGERNQLVKTSNNVNSAQNRRVNYVLSIEKPKMYQGSWKVLAK